MQIGIQNTAKNVSEIYVGVRGTAKRVSEVYLGVRNTAKRESLSSSVIAGTESFTSNTTWVAPFTGYVDVFLCNGGNGGGKGGNAYTLYPSGEGGKAEGGYGGAGGVCQIIEHVKVQKGKSYNVVVGQGGIGTAYAEKQNGSVSSTYDSSVFGGTSSFGDIVNTPNPNTSPEIGFRNGGKGAKSALWNYFNDSECYDGTSGSTGITDFTGTVRGSGGGGGASSFLLDHVSSSVPRNNAEGNGGTNAPKGGISASPNTGAGGGGSKAYAHRIKGTLSIEGLPPTSYDYDLNTVYAGGNGGSGIVQIKWNNGGKMYDFSPLSDGDEEFFESYLGIEDASPDEESYIRNAIRSMSYTRSEMFEIISSSSLDSKTKSELVKLVLDLDEGEGGTP